MHLYKLYEQQLRVPIFILARFATSPVVVLVIGLNLFAAP